MLYYYCEAAIMGCSAFATVMTVLFSMKNNNFKLKILKFYMTLISPYFSDNR